jgi:hypothetical protein
MHHSVDRNALIRASCAKMTTSDKHVHANARPIKSLVAPSSRGSS